jgi:hypothetical protein
MAILMPFGQEPTLIATSSQTATRTHIRLLRTFGDGYPEVFVIQAFMQFSHFWGYRSNNFFNSMRWTEDTSPKVRKSLMWARWQ